MAFQKATKKKAKLKIALMGPAGSGKTYSALIIAQMLGGKTAVIDSEHGRASLYADRFQFDSSEPSEFSLDTYVRNINEAAKGGYDNLIIDSLSHAWSGKGGALEEVDRRSAGKASAFTSGWREVTPKQNNLTDTIRAYPGHTICTMRKKMDYVLEEDEKGKKVPRKVGLAPVQRDGLEYEFDFIFDLDLAGVIRITKSSISELDNVVISRVDLPKSIALIVKWLDDGAAPDPAPPPAPAAEAPTNGHRAAPSQASAKTATEPRPNSQNGKPSKMTAQEADTAEQIAARHDLRVMGIWKRAQALGMTKDTFANWRLSALQGVNIPSRELTDAHMKILEDELATAERARPPAEPSFAEPF